MALVITVSYQMHECVSARLDKRGSQIKQNLKAPRRGHADAKQLFSGIGGASKLSSQPAVDIPMAPEKLVTQNVSAAAALKTISAGNVGGHGAQGTVSAIGAPKIPLKTSLRKVEFSLTEQSQHVEAPSTNSKQEGPTMMQTMHPFSTLPKLALIAVFILSCTCICLCCSLEAYLREKDRLRTEQNRSSSDDIVCEDSEASVGMVKKLSDLVQKGKAKRGADNSNGSGKYKFGDLTRGIIASAGGK